MSQQPQREYSGKDKPSIIFGQNLYAPNQQPDRRLLRWQTLSYLQTTGKRSSLGFCTMVVARKSGGQPHGIAVPGPRDLWVRDRHLAPVTVYTITLSINYMLPKLLLKSFLIYLASKCYCYFQFLWSYCEIWKQRQLYFNTVLNVKNDTVPVSSIQEFVCFFFFFKNCWMNVDWFVSLLH